MKPIISPNNRRWVVRAQRDGTFTVSRQDGADVVPWSFAAKPVAEHYAAYRNAQEES